MTNDSRIAFITSPNNGNDLPTSGIKIMYNIVFPAIMVVGVIGNLIVTMVILKIKDMRNSTNIFLANLALADVIFLLVWGTGVLIDVNSDYDTENLRETICYLLPFTEATVMNVSVLTIVAIGFERHSAVHQPLRSACIWTLKKTSWICMAVWVIAAFLSTFPISFSAHLQVWHSSGRNVTNLCKSKDDSILEVSYQMFGETVFFFASVVSLLLVYTMIARHLRSSVAPSVNNIAIKERRRRVVKTFAGITLCFIALQLPYRVFSLLYRFTPLKQWLESHRQRSLYNMLSFVSRTLLYLHSAVNPILYTLMSKQFRKGFKNIFCFHTRAT